MAKSRGRKFAELVAPTNGVFAAASIPTITLSKLSASTFSVNSESASLGGNVVLDSNDVTEHTNAKYFTNARAQATLSVASNSGHGALAYDNSNGQFTFAGITTEAIQDVVGAQLATNGSHTGVSISYDDAGDGAIDLTVNDATKVPLAGGTMTGNLTLGDNVNAYFGASTDLRIYHDGTNSHIINSTGELRVTGSDIAIKSDSTKLYLGASDDLQIYHDGSHSFISDQGTGHLKLLAGDFRLNNAADNAQMISAVSGGSVYLYDNNSVKLQTTSTGVTVTGLTSMTTGVATSKFAVASTGVHGSYDFYNNGTGYNNGAFTVDDTLFANNVSILGTGILRVGTNQTWSVGVNPSSSIRLAYDGVERSITGHYTDGMSIRTNAHILRLATDGKVHFPAFTFPASDGSANQILQTDGSGAVSWVTNTGGTSIWGQSGSNIYYTSGNVGIGKSSGLTYLLELEGAIGDGTPMIRGTVTGTPANGFNWATEFISANLAAGRRVVHIFGRARSSGAAGHISYYESTVDDNNNQVQLGMYGANDILNVTYDRKVGINTSTPSAPLHVVGADSGIKISSATSDRPHLSLVNGTAEMLRLSANANYAAIGDSTDGQRYMVFRGGNVGIGTDNPATPLHVSSATDQKILLSGSADPYIRWQENTTNKAYIQWNAAGYLEIRNQEDSSGVRIDSGLTVTPSGDEAIVLQGVSNPYIRFQEGTTNKAYIQWNNAGYLTLANQEDASSLRIKDAIEFTLDGSTYHSIWHAGNDGSGSGLDADTLDGVQSSAFLRSDANDTTTGLLTVENDIYLGSSGSRRHLKISSSQWPEVRFFKGTGEKFRIGTADANTTYGNQAEGDFYFYSAVHNNMRLNVPIDGSEITRNNGSIIVMDTGSNYQRKASGIQLGSTGTLTNASATLALAASNPYISFHHGSGARTAYFQEASSRFYFGECTYTETEGSFRAPVFYDVNNTSYYSDQANVSRFNNIRPDTVSTPGSGTATMFVFGKNTGSTDHINFGGSSADPASVTNTVGLSWGTRSDGNGYYLIGVHNYNNGYSTHSRLRLGWHTGLELGANSTYGGVRIFEDSPWMNSTEQARFRGSGGIVFSRSFTDTVDIRTPIYYDSANTGYYVDPASTSNLNILTTNSTTTFNSTVVQSDNQQFRQEGYFRTNTSGQNTNSSADAYSFGYQIEGAWSHPYPDLVLGFHTGIRLGGHTNYGGCRFYGDHPESSSTIVFSTNNGDLHVRATNNIYAYTSDKRLKENFRPIENAVDKVKALGGFIFDWRKDMMDKHAFTPDQEKNDAGLIAQEVQEVMPAAIRRAPFDYDPDEPNQSKSGEEFLTVQYEKMVPLLVEAIKEQQKQIDELKKLLEEKE